MYAIGHTSAHLQKTFKDRFSSLKSEFKKFQKEYNVTSTSWGAFCLVYFGLSEKQIK
jgi:hypothetical protein